MVTIGVIADTHIPKRAKSIPAVVLEGIKDVDLIIHAGDMLTDYVIYELEEIAPVEAVAGNNDDEYITSVLSKEKIITVDGLRIGILHGDGSAKNAFEQAKKSFKSKTVDCVVFGHSHAPVNELIDGVLYFNPGSPTDKRRQERYSYGILTIDEGKITGEIKYF